MLYFMLRSGKLQILFVHNVKERSNLTNLPTRARNDSTRRLY